jgi:ABC-type branched-subunit amino acid transport system substrate-binding protein
MGSAVTGFALGAVMTLLATIAIVPDGGIVNGDQRVAVGTQGAASTGGDVPAAQSGVVANNGAGSAVGQKPGAVAAATGTASGNSKTVECKAGANGGNTDVGVTDREIKLGATVAESGIAQSFLGEVRQAMDAVANKVNRSGGICGRLLKLVYKDDAWDADRGKTDLQNLVSGDKVFALAVVPSSEGLNSASKAGFFAKSGVPVVGSDGMIRTQYSDPFIWPVAAATTTTLHVMMQDAWNRGARHPAIVFENTYRFGVEGAYAFNQAYRRLSGHDILGYTNPDAAGGGGCSSRFCGIPGGQGNYGNQVNSLNSACNDEKTESKCDYLVLLLEPKTAQDWMAVPGVKTPSSFQFRMGGAQPLFTYAFGHNCGDKCDGMRVWTGYNPPIEQFATSPAVSTYVNDLAAQSASADPYNQFTEGGYVGMGLLVEALRKTGANLTRARLAATLETMTYDSGLTKPLTFQPGKHYANSSAQAFEMQSRNGFTGWRFVQDYITDPWLGQDAG